MFPVLDHNAISCQTPLFSQLIYNMLVLKSEQINRILFCKDSAPVLSLYFFRVATGDFYTYDIVSLTYGEYCAAYLYT